MRAVYPCPQIKPLWLDAINDRGFGLWWLLSPDEMVDLLCLMLTKDIRVRPGVGGADQGWG